MSPERTRFPDRPAGILRIVNRTYVLVVAVEAAVLIGLWIFSTYFGL